MDKKSRIGNEELKTILKEFSSYMYFRDYFKDYVLFKDLTNMINRYIKGEDR